MKLTQKLLSFIHRPFNKDPIRFVAFRLTYTGQSMTYSVADNVLTTAVVGGPGVGLTVDLTQYTLASLASFLAGQAGYTVTTTDTGPRSSLRATCLLDSVGKNGDPLLGYESLLYAYLNSVAVELKAAQAQIVEAIKQLSVEKAEAEFIDEHGDYYGVRRLTGEGDEEYAQRIIAEVFQSRSNNVIIASAIDRAAGTVGARVIDVESSAPAPLFFHNNPGPFNGLVNYGGRGYGLFDVNANFLLEGSTNINLFRARVQLVASRFRAAGTHLRNVNIDGFFVPDVVPPQSEDLDFFADLDPLSDRYMRFQSSDAYFNGEYAFGGQILHNTDDGDIFNPDDSGLAVNFGFSLSDQVKLGEFFYDDAITYNGQGFHEKNIAPAADKLVMGSTTALSDTVDPADDDLLVAATPALSDTFVESTFSYNGAAVFDSTANHGETGVAGIITEGLAASGTIVSFSDTQVVDFLVHSGPGVADGQITYGAINRPAADYMALNVTRQTANGPESFVLYV